MIFFAQIVIQKKIAELKALVEPAFAMGLKPTRLDSHMGCLFQTPQLIVTSLKMGQLIQLPVLIKDQCPKE